KHPPATLTPVHAVGCSPEHPVIRQPRQSSDNSDDSDNSDLSPAGWLSSPSLLLRMLRGASLRFLGWS
ncbi:MAG: hypothetical protein K2G82_05385, partial [Paramuribaculum sp.]|nr:hypothetical protein [Paramuribaculum sp.]